jgi:tetratricopeptide (TPR) repeat protein
VYWAPAAFGAAAVASAAMFGEKGYLAVQAEHAREMVSQQRYEESIAFIDDLFQKYADWKTTGAKDGLGTVSALAELKWQRAQAKLASGAPKEEVHAAYKQVLETTALTDRQACALVWILENISFDEYEKAVNSVVRNSRWIDVETMTDKLKELNNWPALKVFMDAVFAKGDCSSTYAERFRRRVGERDKYDIYCKSNPYLTTDYFKKDIKAAESMEGHKRFTEAQKIYENIIEQCGPYQERVRFEAKVCECLMKAGQYDAAFSAIDRFVGRYKNTDRYWTLQAMIWKGQCRILLGETDKALEIFESLIADNPKAEQAAEVCFFTGYLYLLQGQFEKSKQAFSRIIKDYPNSVYLGKAEMYLKRIAELTE